MAIGQALFRNNSIRYRGFELGTVKAGDSLSGSSGILWLCAGRRQPVLAGVFTQNKFCAAPVVVSQKKEWGHNLPVRLIVNTGNANAGTGEQGVA